jgi:hypothetical protein
VPQRASRDYRVSMAFGDCDKRASHGRVELSVGKKEPRASRVATVCSHIRCGTEGNKCCELKA